jgi:hypothetical protein
MPLVQPFLDEAFAFLRNHSFDVSREDWLNFWLDKNIQEAELQTAKKELINELANNANIPEDEKRQKLEHIFCCDPFSKKVVQNLLDFYKRIKDSDSNFERSYTELNLYYEKLNSFWWEIIHGFSGLFDRRIPLSFDLLKKINKRFSLRRRTTNFFNSTKERIKSFFNNKSIKLTLFFVVGFMAIIWLSNMYVENTANDKMNELKGLNVDAQNQTYKDNQDIDLDSM